MRRIEKWMEGGLWYSRLVVLSAVVASLFTAFAVFYMASVDAYYLVTHLMHYASAAQDPAGREVLRAESIRHVVEIVDGYLLATVLLIFSLGLYELFISKIDQAEQADNASQVLVIHSLDDLKTRLAKVVLMILIVRYFEHALGMNFQTPLELLQFAGGIALLGLALYLAHLADRAH